MRNTILSIICFIIGLSLLVTVHEFGHFLAAKAFGVYCYEFSIGFGKKIVRRKRKFGETYFCIGLIPLGGYVSMYGEDVDEGAQEKNKKVDSLNQEETKPEDGEVFEESLNDETPILIPKERSLEHISKPKKALIMSAGIIMNFVLGYILYFISVSCFPFNSITSGGTIIDTPESPITDFGKQLKAINDSYGPEAEYMQFIDISPSIEKDGTSLSNTISLDVVVNDKSDVKYVLLFNNVYESYDHLSIDDQIFTSAKVGDVTTYNYNLYEVIGNKDVTVGDKVFKNVTIYDKAKNYYDNKDNGILEKMTFSINTYKAKVTLSSDNKLEAFEPNVDDLNIKAISGTLTRNAETGKLSTIGISFTVMSKWLGADSFAKAGELWADGTTRVFVAIGDLFTGKNWNQVGGPLAILSQSSAIMKNLPFSSYVQMWGLISVNLAIMNLLPFPGLDGWHLLVTCIEGVTRRKLNAKFKTYASTIGMLLLFAFMGVILIMDIVRFFI